MRATRSSIRRIFNRKSTSNSAQNPPVPPNPFDPSVYPAIAATLIDLLTYEQLLALRRVCKEYQRRCDSRLARALYVGSKIVKARNKALNVVPTFERSWGRDQKIPGLRSPGLIKSAADCPPSCRAALALARVVTLHPPDSVRAQDTYGDDAPRNVEERYVEQCSHIAPYLSNIHTLRIERPLSVAWRNGFPLSCHTLAFDMEVIEYRKGVLAFPALPDTSGFEELFITVRLDRYPLWFPRSYRINSKNYEKRSNVRAPEPPSYPDSIRRVVLQLNPLFLHGEHIEDLDEDRDKGSDIEDDGEGDDEGDKRTASRIKGLLNAAIDFNHLAKFPACQVYVPFRRVDRQRGTAITPARFKACIRSCLRSAGVDEEAAVAILQRFHFPYTYASVVGPEKYGWCHDTDPCRILERSELRHVIDSAMLAPMENLEMTLLKLTEPFTASGCISLGGPLSEVAMYFKDQTGGTTCVDLPLDLASASRVYSAASPAAFGRGRELVFDTSYPSAHEIRPPNFCLTGDMLAHGAVLTFIQRSMSTKPLYATLSKLNVYAEGGLFKAHRDTPRGENHLGTLTLCLPSPFSGGELVVRHKGDEEVFDWASIVGNEDQRQRGIPWAFLYSDCEHEVLPVKSGMRVTVAYDIHVLEAARQPIADPSTVRAAAALEAALEDPALLPEGGVLAFGLQHKYALEKDYEGYGGTPSISGSQDSESESEDSSDEGEDGVEEVGNNDSTNSNTQPAPPVNTLKLSPHEIAEWRANFTFWPSMLKGPDVTLAQILANGGITFEFVAVYQDDSVYATRNRAYRNRDYAVSRNFFEYDGKDERFYDLTLQQIPAANVHWVTEPKSWGIKNHYMACGNEPEARVQYVSVGIYAYVGPPDARRSFDETTFLNVAPLRKA